MAVGDRNWKEFVGPADRWDRQAAMQFTTLVQFGLREHHKLCDVGCGSLRAGRLLIPYLEAGNYYGIEPEQWLVEEGLARYVGSMADYRDPAFITGRTDFPLWMFSTEFDYVLAQSVLTHADSFQVGHFLGQCADTLHPAGIILATWSEGKDFTGTGWQYPRCVTYTCDFMRETGEAVGLRFEQYRNSVLGLQGNWGVWWRRA